MCVERVVVLAFETPYSDLVIRSLAPDVLARVVGIVRSRSLYGDSSFVRGAVRLLRRCAPQLVAWRAWEAIEYASVRAPRLQRLGVVARGLGVPLISSADVNSPGMLDQLRALQPDALLSVYLDQRLSAALAVPRMGSVNVHPSLLPRDRGLFPAFWQVLRGETTGGATAHVMDLGFDTGAVLAQRSFAIAADDDVQVVSVRGARACGAIVQEALDELPRGGSRRVPGHGTYNGLPDARAWRALRARGARYGRVGFVRDLAREG